MFTKVILNPRLFQSLSIWASSYFQDNSEQIAFVPCCFVHMGCTSQSSCLSFSIFLKCFLPDYKYLTSFSKHLIYNSYTLFFSFLWGVNLPVFTGMQGVSFPWTWGLPLTCDPTETVNTHWLQKVTISNTNGLIILTNLPLNTPSVFSIAHNSPYKSQFLFQ